MLYVALDTNILKGVHSISSSEILQLLKNNYAKNSFGSQYLIHACVLSLSFTNHLYYM